MDEKTKATLEVVKSEAVRVLQPMAEKELAKMGKTVEQSIKKLEAYAKKNPEKTTLITAAVGAAVGAALSIYLQSEAKKGKK